MPNIPESQSNLSSAREMDFLFERYGGSVFIFDLSGTDYYFVLFTKNDRPHWRKHVNGFRGLQDMSVSFEEVFETIPMNIREKLVYHLNLFVK